MSLASDDSQPRGNRRALVRVVSRALVALALLCATGGLRAEAPTVYAAASLSEVMQALQTLWAERGGAPFRLSLAASSTLARQLERGAPADLFVSANLAWMEHLERRGVVDADSRRVLARNRLVLLGASHAYPAAAAGGGDAASALRALPPDAVLACGDPEHVPAGAYGQAALDALGLWPDFERRLSRSADVRAALALVQRGEARAGIVYATDAALAPELPRLATFDTALHPPIIYPAAAVPGASEDTLALLAFLGSSEARRIWARHGFLPAAGAPDGR